MKRSKEWLGLLLSLSLCLLGCSDGGETNGDAANSDSNGSASDGTEGDSSTADGDGSEAVAPIQLTVVDRAGYDAAIAEHKGKVVLVDCWATWCRPCMEKFPETIALQDKYRSEGLAVVSISLDEPGFTDDLEEETPAQLKARVLDELKSLDARIENLLFDTTGEKDPFAEMEIDNGTLPHFKLYGRDGELIRVFSSEGAAIDHAEIEKAIKDAL